MATYFLEIKFDPETAERMTVDILRDRFYLSHHWAEGIEKLEDGCTWRIDYKSVKKCQVSWLFVQDDGWFKNVRDVVILNDEVALQETLVKNGEKTG